MKKSFFVFFAVILFLFFLPIICKAKNGVVIYASPIQGSYEVGEVFPVNIWVKTGDYKLDTAVVDLVYPEDFLEVVDMNLNDKFNISIESNGFDNEKGELSIGGAIKGGTTDDIVLATINFKAKRKGSSTIYFKKSSRALHSGQDLLLVLSNAYYSLVERKDGGGNESEKSFLEEKENSVRIEDNEMFNEIFSNESSLIGESPFLRGKVSSPGARVEFNIDQGLFRDRVFANGNGEWEWYFPNSLLVGKYEVEIIAKHPSNSDLTYTLWWTLEKVNLEVSDDLYAIILNSDTDKVKPGKNFNFEIELLHLGSTEEEQTQNEVKFDYYIEDPEQNIVYENEEKILLVDHKLKLGRSMVTTEDFVKGDYKLYANLYIGDKVVEQDMFTFYVGNDYFIYYIIGGALISFLTILGFIKFSK